MCQLRDRRRSADCGCARQCNDAEVAARLQVGERTRIGARMLDHLQRTSNVDGKGGALRAIAHELAVDEAIDSKEFFSPLLPHAGITPFISRAFPEGKSAPHSRVKKGMVRYWCG